MGKNKLENIYGERVDVGCLSCDLISGKVPIPYGKLLNTKYFEAHADFEIPIPGFVILVSKRHIKSVDEFSPAEQKDFLKCLISIRKAMRKVLGIKIVYLIQEEDTLSHFHVWMFPRLTWMKKFGKSVASIKPIMEFAKQRLKNESNLKKVRLSVNKLKQAL